MRSVIRFTDVVIVNDGDLFLDTLISYKEYEVMALIWNVAFNSGRLLIHRCQSLGALVFEPNSAYMRHLSDPMTNNS